MNKNKTTTIANISLPTQFETNVYETVNRQFTQVAVDLYDSLWTSQQVFYRLMQFETNVYEPVNSQFTEVAVDSYDSL